VVDIPELTTQPWRLREHRGNRVGLDLIPTQAPQYGHRVYRVVAAAGAVSLIGTIGDHDKALAELVRFREVDSRGDKYSAADVAHDLGPAIRRAPPKVSGRNGR
jgi:hypothetical protein